MGRIGAQGVRLGCSLLLSSPVIRFFYHLSLWKMYVSDENSTQYFSLCFSIRRVSGDIEVRVDDADVRRRGKILGTGVLAYSIARSAEEHAKAK